MPAKIKVVYIVNKTTNSTIQLRRFLDHVDHNRVDIKIGAFRKNSSDLHVDWLLDAIYPFRRRASDAIQTDGAKQFIKDIEAWRPDLALLDDVYRVHMMLAEMHIPIWQISAFQLWDGLFGRKFSKQLSKAYRFTTKDHTLRRQIEMNSISTRNLLVSYLCDIDSPPQLNPGFEWIRPYFIAGENQNETNGTEPFLFATGRNDPELLRFLRRLPNLHHYTSDWHAEYNSVTMGQFDSIDYIEDLKNCKAYICRGEPILMADAFYNNKFCLLFPAVKDKVSTYYSIVAEKYHLGEQIFTREEIEDIDYALKQKKRLTLNINQSVSFLHEAVESFL